MFRSPRLVIAHAPSLKQEARPAKPGFLHASIEHVGGAGQ
jgi:hypothetical protein